MTGHVPVAFIMALVDADFIRLAERLHVYLIDTVRILCDSFIITTRMIVGGFIQVR